MTGALIYAIVSDPGVSQDRYDLWYDNEHLPSRFKVPGISSGLRYRSLDGKAFLGCYDLDSADVLKSKEYTALSDQASQEEHELMKHITASRRVYKCIYTLGKQASTPPKTLLAVEMTPYPTHEKEFHHWYETFHIPQMADVPGWTRSRRFELIAPNDPDICKFLTLHEFDREDALSVDKAGIVKWKNDVIEIVAHRARTVWVLYQSPITPSGQHIVNHDGIQFNVKIDGNQDGPVIAFCNPLGTNLSVWDKVVAALAPQYRIIRHDQRGHGKTSQPTKPTTFTELADDLVAILDSFEIHKLHALVGCSMGGNVTLHFALHHPSRVDKIIPVDCNPTSSPDARKTWDSRIALIQEKGPDALAENTVARWFTPEWRQNPANTTELEKIRSAFAHTAPNGFITNCRAIDNYDYVEPTKSLNVPCLLICGAQDPLLSAMKELEKAIPGGRLEVIDDCGHLPMIEKPDAFIDIVKGFL